MKKIILAVFVGLTAMAAQAQVGYNYSQYDLGLSASFISPKTDFQNPHSSAAFHAHFTYNYTPFLNYIAELQIGSVKADSISGVGNYAFNNNYTSIAFRAQLQLGELIDYSQSPFKNGFKNFYLSSGIGVIYTDLNISQADISTSETHGSNIFIPIKIGYEAKLFNDYNEPWAKIDIGYQVNYILSDNFDGYTNGKYNDAFTQFVIGFKVGIGGRTSYRKAINY